MYYVCTPDYMRLAEFKTKEEAEEFVKHDYVLATSDETEDGVEEIISPKQMFIVDEDEEIPFNEPADYYYLNAEYYDLINDLPF